MEVSSVPGLETGTTVHADEGMQMRARVWAGPGPPQSQEGGSPQAGPSSNPRVPCSGAPLGSRKGRYG